MYVYIHIYTYNYSWWDDKPIHHWGGSPPCRKRVWVRLGPTPSAMAGKEKVCDSLPDAPPIALCDGQRAAASATKKTVGAARKQPEMFPRFGVVIVCYSCCRDCTLYNSIHICICTCAGSFR